MRLLGASVIVFFPIWVAIGTIMLLCDVSWWGMVKDLAKDAWQAVKTGKIQ